MAAFNYKAVTKEGEVIQGIIEAGSREAVVSQLHLKGQVPIRVEESRQAGKSGGKRRSLRSKKVGIEQITAFTRELSTLLRSGQP